MENNLTIKIPEKKLRDWKIAEVRNAHGERLEDIARTFYDYANDKRGKEDFKAVETLLHCVNTIHKQRESLDWWLYEIRDTLRNELSLLIMENYGTSTLERVKP